MLIFVQRGYAHFLIFFQNEVTVVNVGFPNNSLELFEVNACIFCTFTLCDKIAVKKLIKIYTFKYQKNRAFWMVLFGILNVENYIFNGVTALFLTHVYCLFERPCNSLNIYNIISSEISSMHNFYARMAIKSYIIS